MEKYIRGKVEKDYVRQHRGVMEVETKKIEKYLDMYNRRQERVLQEIIGNEE